MVEDSPITRWLQAVDELDIEAAAALFTSDARLLTADGRRAQGIEAVRTVLTEFLGGLRSTTHRITDQWHQGDVWIAEVEASYELKDWMQTSELPRALVVREGSGGAIADLRVYGAHERSLFEHPTGEEGMWIGERWIPPL
jgi:ketosteroid isomerase-like protein